jgi:hypothetical protein
MNSTFRTVFEFSLLHSFYSDTRCCDFSVSPVNETARVMSNHKILFRNRDHSSTVLIMADDTNTTAARPMTSNGELLFAMRLNSAAFSNFTAEYPSAGKIFLFTNSDDPTIQELTREEISICGTFLSHRVVSNIAVTLTLKDRKGTVLSRTVLPAGSAGETHQFNVKLPGSDFYTVTEDVTATSYTYYSDRELAATSVFGLIRIINHASSPFAYDGKPNYTITFTPRTRAWLYYVVAPGMSGADISSQLNVVDVPETGMSPIMFVKTYPVPVNDKTAALLHKDTSKVILFSSNQQLAFSQAPRKRIELRKNGTVLINHMPNPDVSAPGPEMFIYV